MLQCSIHIERAGFAGEESALAGLGQTVAELMARTRMPSALDDGSLAPVADFGPNPGALRMRLHTPAGSPAKAPLVVVLHGCGQTAAGYAAGAGWLELSDRHGFALLCPEQARTNNANLCFNWFEDGDIRRGLGEAASIAQMVRRATADLDLDASRVFITGLSAGGAMTAVMLAAYPELFAAGAVIAGLPYGAASGMNEALSAMRRVPAHASRAWGDKVRGAAPTPKRWPRIAVWHGDADTTVTPAAAEALALQWCDVHGAKVSTGTPTGVARHTARTWLGADGEPAVQVHSIAGLGHGTPIAAGGPEGCGSAGPWVLECGVSSSQEIARSWGIAAPRRSQPAASGRSGATVGKAAVPPLADVGETITRALRSAGLLR